MATATRPARPAALDAPRRPAIRRSVARLDDHRTALRIAARLRAAPGVPEDAVHLLGYGMHVPPPDVRDAWQALLAGARAGLLYGALVGALLGVLGVAAAGVGILALVALGGIVGAAAGAGIATVLHALDRADGGDRLPVAAHYEIAVDEAAAEAASSILRRPDGGFPPAR